MPSKTGSLPIGTSRQFFSILLQGQFERLELCIDFLWDRYLAICKNTYTLRLDFAVTINEDMSNVDERGVVCAACLVC